MRTFEYRLYPNKQQRHALMQCLIETRRLYNEMLAVSKEHYEQTGKFLFKYDLTAQFRGRGGEHVPASTVQMLADRLDKAFKRFFARKELGEPGGFPRFKKPNRWHSIQLRQPKTDFALTSDGKHLLIPKKLGSFLKIKLHRPLEGIPKTAHLVRRADGHWYALIVCEVQSELHHLQSPCDHADIGIDVGLKSFLTDSEGCIIANPRFYRTSQKTLKRKQRVLCRRKKGSKRRRKAVRSTAQTHLKIKRQRRDHQFKTAKPYAEGYQRIVVEDLAITNMVQNHHLAKSIHDAAWGTFLDILEDKAARAGHQVIQLTHASLRRTVSCVERLSKSLSVFALTFVLSGGYIADRDVNAAQNILRAGARPSGTLSDGSPDELRSPQL